MYLKESTECESQITVQKSVRIMCVATTGCARKVPEAAWRPEPGRRGLEGTPVGRFKHWPAYRRAYLLRDRRESF
jgi:hypothetical protein